MPAQRWLLIGEAAAYVGCSTKTLYRALDKGTLRGHKRASRWRFDPADLDAWIRGETATAKKRSSNRSTTKPDGFLSSVYREVQEEEA